MKHVTNSGDLQPLAECCLLQLPLPWGSAYVPHAPPLGSISFRVTTFSATTFALRPQPGSAVSLGLSSPPHPIKGAVLPLSPQKFSQGCMELLGVNCFRKQHLQAKLLIFQRTKPSKH